jgi:hypothetical protein
MNSELVGFSLLLADGVSKHPLDEVHVFPRVPRDLDSMADGTVYTLLGVVKYFWAMVG